MGAGGAAMARWRARLRLLLAWLAALPLAFAALITLVDIALRGAARLWGLALGTAPGWGLVGAVDLVQLGVVATAAFAIPYAFLVEGHVAVDLLHARLPPLPRRLLELFARLASLVFLLLVLRYGLDQLAMVRLMGDRSVTLQLPMAWYWWPFLAGFALAALAVVLELAGWGRAREAPS